MISEAISGFMASMIGAYGIGIISFVTGDVHQALAAYLQDGLWTRISGCGMEGQAPQTLQRRLRPKEAMIVTS